MDNKEIEKRDSKRSKAKTARGRRAKETGGYPNEQIDWVAIVALSEALFNIGGAVRVGKTRDGGSIALGIYVGEDYATEYIRPSEDFYTAIEEIVEAWIPDGLVPFRTRYRTLTSASL